MTALEKTFSVKHIICLLGNRNFADFEFRNGCAYVYSREAGEIVIEAPDGQIPDILVGDVIKTLEHLDECIHKGHLWLKDAKIDLERYPHALDKGFAVYGMYFGNCFWNDDLFPNGIGFTMTFTTVESYPLDFTVKFFSDRHPIALEVWGC